MEFNERKMFAERRRKSSGLTAIHGLMAASDMAACKLQTAAKSHTHTGSLYLY